MAEGFRSLFRFYGGVVYTPPAPPVRRTSRQAINTVVPLAKERYERREEQGFRDYARRNIDKALGTASAISEAFRFGNLPEYADDTAAGAGGLIQGEFYRTATGVLMVKL